MLQPLMMNLDYAKGTVSGGEVPGPYTIDAQQAFWPGTQAAQAFSRQTPAAQGYNPGTANAQGFTPGTQAAQGCCS